MNTKSMLMTDFSGREHAPNLARHSDEIRMLNLVLKCKRRDC